MTDAEMARGGYCSLYHRGYTSEKIHEIVQQRFRDDATGANTDAVITELLDGVVHDYMAFRARILRDRFAGVRSGTNANLHSHHQHLSKAS